MMAPIFPALTRDVVARQVPQKALDPIGDRIGHAPLSVISTDWDDVSCSA